MKDHSLCVLSWYQGFVFWYLLHWLYIIAVAIICLHFLPSSDVNECASSENNCNRNALCINTAGGFRCTCKQGFVGNGIICTAGKKYMYVVSAISLYIKLKIIMHAAEDHICWMTLLRAAVLSRSTPCHDFFYYVVTHSSGLGEV